SVSVPGSGTYVVAGLEIDVEVRPTSVAWSVANASGAPVVIDAITYEWLEEAGAEVVVFVNGYQSWSPTGARKLGEASAPSQPPKGFRFIRAVHHADPDVVTPGELRSELVTVADFGTGAGPCCIGFDGGSTHSGTIRFIRADDGVRVSAQAWLGGAVLPAG